ncbi:hypothetical protein NPIL_230751 [Nephila pilipes]|uniref:Uncharacterized protein n=1 Tax=Nephila pilipes TaxID=299642 RepID=A0A8X6MT21_NEPPI|nr:hypothetical protein NPIL_230751 [Nephila pilipes]
MKVYNRDLVDTERAKWYCSPLGILRRINNLKESNGERKLRDKYRALSTRSRPYIQYFENRKLFFCPFRNGSQRCDLNY